MTAQQTSTTIGTPRRASHPAAGWRTRRRAGTGGSRYSDAVLEGGDGQPVVPLHGPGESAVTWRWIPELVTSHRAIAQTCPPTVRPSGASMRITVGDSRLGETRFEAACRRLAEGPG